MVDIDHFKSVNDGYGHLVGDQVIHRLAATLRENVAAQDLVCRYGGEVHTEHRAKGVGLQPGERLREIREEHGDDLSLLLQNVRTLVGHLQRCAGALLHRRRDLRAR